MQIVFNISCELSASNRQFTQNVKPDLLVTKKDVTVSPHAVMI